MSLAWNTESDWIPGRRTLSSLVKYGISAEVRPLTYHMESDALGMLQLWACVGQIINYLWAFLCWSKFNVWLETISKFFNDKFCIILLYHVDSLLLWRDERFVTVSNYRVLICVFVSFYLLYICDASPSVWGMTWWVIRNYWWCTAVVG